MSNGWNDYRMGLVSCLNFYADILTLSEEQARRAFVEYYSYLVSVGKSPNSFASTNDRVVVLEYEDNPQVRIAEARERYATFLKWYPMVSCSMDNRGIDPDTKLQAILFFEVARDTAEEILAALSGMKNYNYPASDNYDTGLRHAQRKSGIWGQEAYHIARFNPEPERCLYEFIDSLYGYSFWGMRMDLEYPLMDRNHLDIALTCFGRRIWLLNTQYDLRAEFRLLLPAVEAELQRVYHDSSLTLF